MEIALQIIISSGLLVAIYKYYSQIKLQNKLKLTEIKENNFRSILIYMDIILYPEHLIQTSEINDPILKNIDINNTNAIIEFYQSKLGAHKSNLYLYADDKLIQLVNEFLKNPNVNNYIIVAKRMNRNLWK